MDQDFTLSIVLDVQKDNGARHWAQLHQCLLMLIDSPLNHASLLEIYIRLYDRRVIRLHKEVRIPRTIKRFEQLFNNFLDGCDMPLVQTKDGQARLFQILTKPIERIFPERCPRYRVTNLVANVKTPDFLVEPVETNKRVIIFIDVEPVDFNFLGNSRESEYDLKFKVAKPEPDTLSISHYPITASLTCAKITSAFERALEIF